jgi:methionyl-tRNA formyltransferase
VKRAAVELGLRVTDDMDELVAAAGAGVELGVVVAFGRIIPARVLEVMPMVNMHFSLLPRWRGAAPVERAILAGDPVTGVCIMKVEEGLDTGPVYAREELAVDPEEDLAHLRRRLVEVGNRLLVEVLDGGVPDGRSAVPQAGVPTYAEKLDPAELELNWDRPAELLARVVRLGGAWTTFRGRRLRVLGARAVVGAGLPAADGEPIPLAPGRLEGETVGTGLGRLRLSVVQPEGKRAMAADEWLRGVRPRPGETLGEPVSVAAESDRLS